MAIQIKTDGRGETPQHGRFFACHRFDSSASECARDTLGRDGRLQSTAMPESSHPREANGPTHARGGNLGTLGLAALGVVFGDIGTSPLYTLHECTMPEHGAAPTPENILGVLSLIFWSLTMVVTVKYLTFVMRADNQGEGGILALLALIPERLRTTKSGRIGWVAVLVIIGAA